VKGFLATSCVLLALAIVASGCNVASTPSVAARVNSSTITTADLNGMMTALKGDPDCVCSGGPAAPPPTTGVGTGTWNAAFAGYVLTQLIKFSLLHQLVTARHLQVLSTDQNTAKAEVESAIEATGQTKCSGTVASAVGNAGSFQTALLDNQLDQDAYSAFLAGASLQPASLARWERIHRSSATQSCTSVIGVSTQALALAIAKAIRAGSSFASEATKNSRLSGTGPGGDVGCVLPGTLPSGLGTVVANLKIGAVSKPVDYDGGWLLFSVRKRQLEPTVDVVPLLNQLEVTAFNAEYAKALGAAHISVSPAYGTLQRKVEQGGISLAIVPPSTKACAYALSGTAAGCPTTTTTLPATGSAPSG
jgi:parvulin-like peptidyl-prolyl isomerase